MSHVKVSDPELFAKKDVDGSGRVYLGQEYASTEVRIAVELVDSSTLRGVDAAEDIDHLSVADQVELAAHMSPEALSALRGALCSPQTGTDDPDWRDMDLDRDERAATKQVVREYIDANDLTIEEGDSEVREGGRGQ